MVKSDLGGLKWAVISLQIEWSELLPGHIGVWLIDILNGTVNSDGEIFCFSEGDCELCTETCFSGKLFSPLHALNFGIGSDSMQHVLWRLENGELEHNRPKIMVVWVGTKNHGHTAEQVTGGIKATVELVNQRQPQARIMVLGLLPRGQHPNPLREKNRWVNELVRAALAGHTQAHFLDADPGFVHSDGTISHHDMYDYLHLSCLGYTPVCRALHSLLLRLLAQEQGQGVPLPEATP
ncbi:platelet-activating factor acetylhydrolase IB subunit alpha1-like [Meles meles]|uniref:platelet-activating factor acetylhydrolase IB subunit alpha1-like n=1 Tax=Meles meles TaxID=9662 RepID=UPI001E6992DE|nr:platelet-activating factor acetylhydrolase IB subunit alpha1-like [Meles meles]